MRVDIPLVSAVLCVHYSTCIVSSFCVSELTCVLSFVLRSCHGRVWAAYAGALPPWSVTDGSRPTERDQREINARVESGTFSFYGVHCVVTSRDRWRAVHVV